MVAAAFPIVVAGGLNGPTGAGVLSFFLAPGWAGYRGNPRRSWLAPLSAQLMASLGTWVAGRATGSTVGGLGAIAWENLFFGLLCWGAWGVGLLARRLRHRATLLARLAEAMEAERDAREHAILVEERQRIARDMHDVVAHSISVMVLQLGAIRSTLPPDTAQAEMMRNVERLGRESVRELRALVGMLRDAASNEPVRNPSLARADELVAEVRAAGLPVDLTVDGDIAELPAALDVSAYRILQEALANVLRHAGTVPTRVVVHRAGDRLGLTIDNDPPPGARPDRDPTAGPGGHGLVGMRERVSVYGGRLAAGPRPDGGYGVDAVFPIGARR
ncbi:sensor histidine kinase [Amorphoplanes digitatis]|uniref:histidine kinase n=1 Tax=Actinoplanes digitatis TaxID=1868 RepID=A0A7W7MS85_9ACTN|nr:histidine kinase [Actinoplanes digitatis]MBB4764405.1 signal transduction histidine kinase [Actinoplanes digitatis]GID94108.1 two-component sensor histidine kinase [Actinoplanes digitatis]